jgi:hypothetical protein
MKLVIRKVPGAGYPWGGRPWGVYDPEGVLLSTRHTHREAIEMAGRFIRAYNA